MLGGRGVLVFGLAIMASPLWAADKRQGALVKRDGAPVYQTAEATSPAVVLNRGKAVSAISGNIILKPDYRFDEGEGGGCQLYAEFPPLRDDRLPPL